MLRFTALKKEGWIQIKKTPFYCKILIFLLIILDYLTIRSDLVRFEQISRFSKIEGSIIPSECELFWVLF